MARSWAGPGSRAGGTALAGLAILLVVAEFLLGTWTNLYDQFLPSSLRSVFDQPYLSNDRALALHVALAVLLGVVAVALLAWAGLRHRPRVAMAAFGGLLGVAIATLGGYQFIATPDPIYSFLMALGFLIALGAYMRAMTVLLRGPRPGMGPWGVPPGAMPPGPVNPPSPGAPPS